MPVIVSFIVESETYGRRGFKIRDRNGNNVIPPVNGNFSEADATSGVRNGGEYGINSNIGRRLIQGALSVDIPEIASILSDINDVFANFYALIDISGVDDLRGFAVQSKSGKRLQDPVTKTWVKDTTLLRRYPLNQLIKNILHENYELNDSGDENCMFHLAKQKWGTGAKKISPKKLKKWFEKDATVGKLIDFCDEYKIPLKITNIEGKLIYKNNLPPLKRYKSLYIKITNNHPYPLESGLKNIFTDIKKQPTELTKNDILKPSYLKHNVVMCKNGTYYTPDGMVAPINDDGVPFCVEFYEKIKNDNYFHKSDIREINVPTYIDTKRYNEKKSIEYDLISAWGSMALSEEIKRDRIPVFSCIDVWEKYDKEQPLYDNAYYLLKNDTADKLRKYGETTNHITGHRLMLYMKYKKVSYDCIKSVKIPSGTTPFPFEAFETVRLFLEKKNISPKQILNKIRIYIGILGSIKKQNKHEILGCDKDEEVLLNVDYERWQYDDELKTFNRESQSFKHLNACNVRNHIIDKSSCMLIENILYIEKETGLLPFKIQCDAICYNKEVELLHPNQFKAVIKYGRKIKNKQKLFIKRGTIHISENNINYNYYRRVDIKRGIKEELKDLKNSTITGAPGTGKTTIMKTRPQNFSRCATYTNMCKRNMGCGASTLHSLFQQFVGKGEDIHKVLISLQGLRIWIDEFSMVPPRFWNIIMLGSLQYRIKFLFTGDINQCPPVKGKPFTLNNFIMKAILGDFETLTKDYRNDAGLIKLRDAVLNTNSKDELQELVGGVLDTTPWEEYERHITYTRDMRKYINSCVIKKYGYKFKFNGNKLDVSIGVLLKARENNETIGLGKSSLWRVEGRDDDMYTIRDIGTNEVKEIHDMKYFDLGYADTYHSTQGLTITDDLCLHEIDHYYSNKNVIYTGITRAKERNKIHIYKKFIIPFEWRSYYLPSLKEWGN